MMFGKNPGTDATWKRIPEYSVGAELGVWKGDSSLKFLKRACHIFSHPYLSNNCSIILIAVPQIDRHENCLVYILYS